MATTSILRPNQKPAWEFDPRSVPGCQLWLDADDTSTITISTGISISAWRDKSVNNKSATANGTTKPTRVTAGRNRRAYVSFGTAGYFTITSPFSLGTGDFAIFAVVQVPNGSVTSNYILARNDGGTESWEMRVSTTVGGAIEALYTAGGVTSMTTSTQNLSNSWTVESFVALRGTSSTLYDLGLQVAQTSTVSSGTLSTASPYSLCIGSRTTTASGLWQSNMAEILVYSGTISNTTRQQIEGYLAWKWGLNASVNTLHPYTSTARTTCPPRLRSLHAPDIQTPLWLWFDASDDSTVFWDQVNYSVVRWQDKSGNRNDLQTWNSGVQPVYDIANRRVQFMSGLFGSITNNNLQLGQSSYSGFIVMSCAAITGGNSETPAINGIRVETTTGFSYIGINRLPYTDVPSPTVTYSMTFNNLGFNFLTITGANAPNALQDIPLVMYWSQTSPSTLSFTVNGGAVYNITGVSVSPIADYVQIGNILGSSPSNIHEILMFGDALSVTDRQRVEAYLMWKWNKQRNITDPAQVQFPTTHPFYKFPSASVTPFLPSTVGGLSCWLDAADPLRVRPLPPPSPPQNLTYWIDKAGAAVLFQPATATAGIQYTSATVNGLNAITFSTSRGANVLTRQATLPMATFSIFVVLVPTALGAGAIQTWTFLSTSVSATLRMGFEQTSGNLRFRTAYSATNVDNGINVPFSTPSIFEATYDGTTLCSYTNGLGSSSPVTSSLTNETLVLLAGQNISGTICEVVVFDHALSTNQGAQVEGYLAWKWGVARLGFYHPYKNVRI